MSKFKYYMCIILWTFMPQLSFAVDFELSDVIREARINQMKMSKSFANKAIAEKNKMITKSHIQNNVEQTKNQFKAQQNQNDIHNAAEKLNPKEIMNQE